MPRAPAYQPNQIGPVGIDNARFRPANNNGGVFGAVGEGLQELAGASSQAAEAQDHIDAQFDDTEARKLAIAAQAELADTRNQYQLLAAGNAVQARADTDAQIEAAYSASLERATNPRMRGMLEERMAPFYADTRNAIAGHAAKEAMVDRSNTLTGQAVHFGTLAAGENDPAARDKLIASGLAVVRDKLMTIDGVTSPDLIAAKELEYTSGVHASVVDRMLASPDPHVDEVLAYAVAYQDEMTPGDFTKTLERLQKPFQERIDRSDADSVMAGIVGAAPATAAPGTGAPSAVALLRDFEGFRENTYWDVNHHRVGYGSDTITTASGQVRTVKAGDRVSREDAERDLARRTGALEQVAARKAGAGWNALPEGARAAVVSVAYNYGEDSSRLAPLWDAAKRGDAGAVSAVITSFANDNGGVNRGRRMQEAAAAIGGAGSAYANAPREWDRAAVEKKLNETASAQGWTPERTERARQEIDRRIARDQSLLSDQQADADNDAGEIVLAKGTGFTSTNQIPRTVWERLSVADRAKYEGVAATNSKPKEAEANGPAVMTLNQMRFLEPDKFQTMNLAQYVGKVTNAEMDTLLSQQAQMRAKGPDAWSPRSGIVTALSYGKKIGGMDLEPEQETAILQIMEAEANRLYVQNGKKPLTDQQYGDLFRSATREVRTTGFFGGASSKPRYDLTTSNMPDTQRARLTTQFKKAMGREPTEDELLRLYRVETRK